MQKIEVVITINQGHSLQHALIVVKKLAILLLQEDQ
jgi:hypothetical protein